MSGPRDDSVEYDSSSIRQGVLVVPGGQSSPLLDMAVTTLDDVAVLIVSSIQPDRTSTAGATTLPMSLLIIRFRDDGLDPTSAQVLADRARRVRLVRTHRDRAGPGTPDFPEHPQMLHQRQEHRRITRLPWAQQHDQGQTVAVDELVDLRGQAAAGATDAVIRRLDAQILVTR